MKWYRSSTNLLVVALRHLRCGRPIAGADTYHQVEFIRAKPIEYEIISHIDCPGGGQVWVEGTTLYVGHMRPTSGTTIIDVADPRQPKTLAKISRSRGLAFP